MLYNSFQQSKAIPLTAAATVVATITVFVFTNNYFAFVLPLAYLFLLLTYLNWKISYWLLLCAIPFSITINIGNSLSTTLPDEPITILLAGLGVLLYAQKPSALKNWWWKDKIALIVGLQLICLIISVIYSQVFYLSLKFLVAKLWMLVTFFILPIWLLKEKKDWVNMFKALAVAVFITVFIILYRHYQYDFLFNTANAACSIFYYNHVEYAAILSLFFPVVLTAYWCSNKSGLLKKVFLGALCIILLAAIFFAYARSAILALVFAGIVAIAIRIRLVNFILPIMFGLIALLIVYLSTDYTYIKYRPNYEQTYMRKNLEQHIQATITGQDMSTMERVYRWVAAARMSTVHPLTGFGPHGFTKHYKSYTAPEFRTYVSDNTEHSTTHNYMMYILTEQGWPAMILYMILNILVLARAQKLYHRFKDRFYKKCTLGIAMILAVSFVNNSFSELIETHKAGALFYLAIAALMVLTHINKKEQQTNNDVDTLPI